MLSHSVNIAKHSNAVLWSEVHHTLAGLRRQVTVSVSVTVTNILKITNLEGRKVYLDS